jgi:hypothetical protein
MQPADAAYLCGQSQHLLMYVMLLLLLLLLQAGRQ